MTDDPVIESDISFSDFFGLSYANYLVIPRAVLQAMPAEWQAKMVALIEQIEGRFAEYDGHHVYEVRLRGEGGRFEVDPLSNYRWVSLTSASTPPSPPSGTPGPAAGSAGCGNESNPPP